MAFFTINYDQNRSPWNNTFDYNIPSEEFRNMIVDYNWNTNNMNFNMTSHLMPIHNQLYSYDSYDIMKRLNLIEQKLIYDEILIDGLPIIETSKLPKLFTDICNKLNIIEPSYKDIYQFKNQSSFSRCTIVVKLNTIIDKRNFLRASGIFCKKFRRTLQYSDIGIQSFGRIFISERLSRENYKLYREAMKLKKDKILHKVFVRNSRIYICSDKKDKPKIIFSKDDLKCYNIRNNELCFLLN